MDFIILLVLFGLLVVVGAVCGLIALIRLSRLERELTQLRAQLAGQGAPVRSVPQPAAIPLPPAMPAPPPPSPRLQPEPKITPPKPAAAEAAPRRDGTTLERDLASRWLVWVGGVALALGGIFLVKFGVEHT